MVSFFRDAVGAVTGPIGQGLGAVCGLTYAEDLPSRGPLGSRQRTLQYLGFCAKAVYGADDRGEPDECDMGGRDGSWVPTEVRLESKYHRSNIQCALYVHANYRNVGIISFRGTATGRGLQQDISLGLAGGTARQAVRDGCDYFNEMTSAYPHLTLYVTGHSLGGFIAEAVASYCDVGGAGFNSPGPWASTEAMNMTGRHRPCFEIHLTKADPVGALFFPKPEDSHHIGTPKWHEGWGVNAHARCGDYFPEVLTQLPRLK